MATGRLGSSGAFGGWSETRANEKTPSGRHAVKPVTPPLWSREKVNGMPVSRLKKRVSDSGRSSPGRFGQNAVGMDGHNRAGKPSARSTFEAAGDGSCLFNVYCANSRSPSRRMPMPGCRLAQTMCPSGNAPMTAMATTTSIVPQSTAHRLRKPVARQSKATMIARQTLAGIPTRAFGPLSNNGRSRPIPNARFGESSVLPHARVVNLAADDRLLRSSVRLPFAFQQGDTDGVSAWEIVGVYQDHHAALPRLVEAGERSQTRLMLPSCRMNLVPCGPGLMNQPNPMSMSLDWSFRAW